MNIDIFIAPLWISSISALLAIIIVVIDKIVNNYGEVKVIINKEKELTVQGGDDLLRSLSANKIFLPSACGGRGSCGACKTKVISDIGKVLPTELPYLNKEELDNNIRLSCQVKVKSDIDIEIPEELFNIKKFKGRVTSIEDLTHDIKEVLIELSDHNIITFKAGQYAQLEVPSYEKIKSPTQRAYSISSKPQKNKVVEFIIRLVPGGIVTTYIHNYLKIGEELDLIGPFGDFYVQDTKADLICVAGGSGMAPIKSIIHDLLDKSEQERELWYFFGARTKKDLFYLEEMSEISKEWKNFHFIPALSEPASDDNWKGEAGLITDVLEKYLKEKINSKNGQEGYLCGSPGMIDACVDVMTRCGIPDNKIYYDKFA